MKLAEILRPQTELAEARPPRREKPPPPPQDAWTTAIQDCLNCVNRLTTTNPKIRSALDEAKRALLLAKDIAKDDERRMPPPVR
jgi:hypothetical protein